MADYEDFPEDLVQENGGTIFEGIYIPPPLQPPNAPKAIGPRLIISHITSKFFKSVGPMQTMGPFHQGFNGIVGANGSGKSNTIDALLFVFGYRAKNLRTKNVSKLIHKSDAYFDAPSATVSVHFCSINDKEGNNYEVVPNTELVVTRTAFRDNSSVYEINGKRVQLKEVSKLCRNYGIDLVNNRFLILQGEVEQIAMMKCKGSEEGETGILEYLEDVIGTDRYKTPLLKLSDRIEHLSEEKENKTNRLDMVSKVLNELQAPMEEAVKFLQFENIVNKCKNILYQKNKLENEEKLEQIEEKRNGVLEIQQTCLSKLEKVSQEKKDQERVLKKEESRFKNLQSRKAKLDEAVKVANNKHEELQENLRQVNSQRKVAKKDIESAEKKVLELEKVPDKNNKEIEELKEKETKYLAEREILQQKKIELLDSSKEETGHLIKKKEEIQVDLGVLKSALHKSKAEFTLAESELKIYLNSGQEEQNKLETMRQSYEEMKVTFQERKVQVESLKKKIPETEQSIKEALKELVDIRKEEGKIVEEMGAKRSLMAEKRSNMQNTRSRGKVLDSLMNQKRQGLCPGLYGRLGDLGAIDKKYDAAVSTACGPLDNIVVDTVSTAEQCIEFLKKYNLGRAKFIALDQQQHLQQFANSKIQTPENIHRLYDLIKVQNEDVRVAFYYALRDTLVANDLDQAVRVAYGAKRYRVVTLDGNLIETSGIMSGGGVVSRGRMGQSVQRDEGIERVELENMERTYSNLETRLEQLRQRIQPLDSRATTMQPELKKMKVDYENFSKQLVNLRQQLPHMERRVDEQEDKAKGCLKDPVEEGKLTKIVEQKKKKYDEASVAAGGLQKEVDKLTEKIKEKTIGKTKEVDKKLTDLAKNMEKCKKEIVKLTAELTTVERNQKQLRENLESSKKKLIECEEKIKAMLAEREEIEQDAQNMMKCIEEVDKEVTETEESYRDVKKAFGVLTEEQNKLNSEKVDIDRKVAAVDSQHQEIKHIIRGLEERIKQLTLHSLASDEEGGKEELETYDKESLEKKDLEKVKKELKGAEDYLKAAKPNLAVIEEYRGKEKVVKQRKAELEEVNNKRKQFWQVHEDLTKRRKNEFLAGFELIKIRLKEIYRILTMSGDADLELVDVMNPFNAGVQFYVRPPRKTWKPIMNLSGGEKTLSSLSLVFALHHHKPSPFYVMDEIDAALDYKNVSIIGHYIRERTKNTQFIIISLRPYMYELSNLLVGIYKTNNMTKTITFDHTASNEPSNEFSPSYSPEKDLHKSISITNNENEKEPIVPDSTKNMDLNGSSCENDLNEKEAETNKVSGLPKNMEPNGSLSEEDLNESGIETNDVSGSLVNMDLDDSLSENDLNEKVAETNNVFGSPKNIEPNVSLPEKDLNEREVETDVSGSSKKTNTKSDLSENVSINTTSNEVEGETTITGSVEKVVSRDSPEKVLNSSIDNGKEADSIVADSPEKMDLQDISPQIESNEGTSDKPETETITSSSHEKMDLD